MANASLTKVDQKNSEGNRGTSQMIQRWLSEGAANLTDVHERIAENFTYLAGDTQWRKGDIERQEAKGRPHMVLNLVLQAVNAVANREVMDRFVPKVFGRDKSDGAIAGVLDEVLRWVRDQCEAPYYESDAFRDLVATGFACMHVYFDDLEEEGRGKIKVEAVPAWEMLWDSRARDQNLVDRRWHMRGRWVSRIEVEEEFREALSKKPEVRKKFSVLQGGAKDWDLPGGSGKAGASRWPWDTISGGKWYNRADDEVFLIEVEWRDLVVRYDAAVPVRMWEFLALFADPLAVVQIPPDPSAPPPEDGSEPQGEEITYDMWMQMSAEDQAYYRSIILAETEMETFEEYQELEAAVLFPWFDATGEDFRDWAKNRGYEQRYAFQIEDMILEEGSRSTFRYEFMTGNPSKSRDMVTHFGIVDVAKGPQDWRNTFMSLILTRLATSPKELLLVEETAVTDMDNFIDQFANPRGLAIVPDGFVAGNRHKTLSAPSFPAIEGQLIQMADQGVMQAAGLSSADFGGQADLRRISGSVVQQVKESSNTVNVTYFDALRRSRTRMAKIMLQMVTEFYDVETVRRAIGEQFSQSLDESQVDLLESWPEIRRFDIKLDETQVTPTEMLAWWDKMTNTDIVTNWIADDRVPFDTVVGWAPWMNDFDRQNIREHNKDRETKEGLQEKLDFAESQLLSLKNQLANAGPEAQRALLAYSAKEEASKTGNEEEEEEESEPAPEQE